MTANKDTKPDFDFLYREVQKLDNGEHAQLTEADIHRIHNDSIKTLETNMDRRDIHISVYQRYAKEAEDRIQKLRKQLVTQK